MDLKIILNLLLFFVLFSRTTCQVDKGTPVDDDELKFLVHLKVTKKSKSGISTTSFSGGSIINSRWILTCKHSFENKIKFIDRKIETLVPYEVEVQAGTKKSLRHQTDEGQRKTIIINKNNLIRHRKSDAALIYLGENPLQITDRVQPATFIRPGQNLAVGTTCTTSGWGKCPQEKLDGSRPTRNPENALKGEMRIVKCHKSSKDSLTGLCYERTETQQRSAEGDSGGPITCEVGGKKEVVVGIVHGSCGKKMRKNPRTSAVDMKKIYNWVQGKTKADSERDAKDAKDAQSKKMSEIFGVFAAIGTVAFYYNR